MWGFVRGLLYGLLLIGAGWIGGSIYPAPAEVTAPIGRRTDQMLERVDFSPQTLASLRASLSADEFARLSRQAADFAANAGSALVIEHDSEALEEMAADAAMEYEIAAAPAPSAPAQAAPGSAPGAAPPSAPPSASGAAPAAPAPAAGAALFEAELALCPRMTVSNAPPADEQRRVRDFTSIVDVQGVRLAVNPTRGACLSSMFGPRGGRMHKGLDLHSADGGPILAAADGVVIEKKYRDDYGNMLLIDHGNGVYTRYAHLAGFQRGVDVGARVRAGQQIGLMGNTAAYRIPVHLHYELLLGDYANPRGSFGLTPRSPLEFPAAL